MDPVLSSKRRRLLVVGAVVVAVVVATIVAYAVWPRGSELERAAARLPDGTARFAWTDWSGVRDELDAGDLSDPGAAEEFLLAAGDADLSTASATAGDAVVLAEQLGFAPHTSEWELLGQSAEGMVLVIDVGEDVDLGEVADRFEGFGYLRPDDAALEGGLWEGGADVLTNIPGLGNPALANVAFFEDERLLVASDNAAYLEDALPSVADEDGLDLGGLAADVDEPLSAVGLLGDTACDELSMESADPAAQAQAEAAIEDVGGVSRLDGYLVALEDGDELAIVLGFEDEDQAGRNEEPRRLLAALDDPGQMVSYPELFSVDDSRVEDNRVILDLAPVAGSFPLSNLTSGPVLLASC